VADALLHRKGYYGELLHMAEYLDRIEQSTPQLLETMHAFELGSEDLVALELAAFEWSDNVCRTAAA
jgi:EAL and modified HD-GYP domain-containing signal transduction protein